LSQQERRWTKRVDQWHSHVNSAAGFEKVLDALVARAEPRPDDVAVDLGAGTGFVTMALAPKVASILAVDISPAMTEELAKNAAEAGLSNVTAEVGDLTSFALPPASVDLIVSSYVLHHLLDPGKQALVRESINWLKPGGRLVIADMMFGRGGTARDRAILKQKAVALAKKGPGGVWRIAKNLGRYGLGVGGEHPATPEFWQQALRDAGYTGVAFTPVVAEAGLVSGQKP